MVCGIATAAPREITFSQSSPSVEAYDFVEIVIQVSPPDLRNPFTEAFVAGSFAKAGSTDRAKVDGFCDSADGTVYRIRFMPSQPGDYSYVVTYRQGDSDKTYSGTFRSLDGRRRGILRVDPNYPWHFQWEGTSEHYFFNGTTAFLMMGWQDENVIRGIIDRLHGLKVNRIRLMLAARVVFSLWGEPIMPNREFRAYLNPWIAEQPDDVTHPGLDYTRFDVSYWQRFERMLRYAREKDMIISVILDWNDSGKVHPAAGSEDELRYFRYAAARFGAYSNVNWDLGDDITAYRDDAWAHKVGPLLKQWDVYKHLATNHPNSNREPLDRASDWMDFTSFQQWHRPIHGWMLGQRERQVKLGRIIPQTDEEYGYEDHYPHGSSYGYPNGQSADGNRRVAWEFSMAGTYQTTGETAKRGTGVWPDTGGGWINGRGDDSMVMLSGYAHMVDFFTSFEWWKTNPHDELVDSGAFCLADPGNAYVIYLPMGGKVTVKLLPGHYRTMWFNARNGQSSAAADADGPEWTSPAASDNGDWALLLIKK
jgi:hypothetical protein